MKRNLLTLFIVVVLILGNSKVIAAGETELTVFNSLKSYGIEELFVSPDGKTVITGGKNAMAHLWYIQSGVKKEIEDISYRFLTALAFSPDGKQFAVATADHYGLYNSIIFTYSTQSGELIDRLNIPIGAAVNSISYSNDGKSLFIGYVNRIIDWGLDTKKINSEYSTNGSTESIEFHPKREELAVSFISDYSENSTRLLQIRSKQTGEILHTINDAIPNKIKEFNDMQYSPDGKYFIVSYDQYSLSGSKVYDAENNYTLVTNLEAAGSISFNEEASFVVIGQHVYSIKDNFKTSYGIKAKVTPFSTTLASGGKYLISRDGDDILIFDAKNLFVHLTDIQILPEELRIGVNEQISLQLQGLYSDGSNKLLPSSEVKWTVQDFHIAEVEDSVLYGVGIGQTKLTANYSGLTASIDVLIEDVQGRDISDSSSDKQIILKVNSSDMLVNGVSMPVDTNTNTKPLIRNGRTLLPIASIIREFGGTVDWNGDERKVIIQLGSNQVVLWIDKNNAIVNGKSKVLDVAPTIINGKTMVPLRFVSENTGINLFWHGSSQVISLFYHGNDETTFWFEGDHVEHVSNTQGIYLDGGALYSIQYPLSWGDPYVVNNKYSANNIETEYDYQTVFYDSNGNKVTGDVVALEIDESGQYESAEDFMRRTGREGSTDVFNNMYRERVIEQRDHPTSDLTYFVITTETPLSQKGKLSLENEFLFFKGAYVVIVKFEGSVDYEEFIEADPSVIPHFDAFIEAIASFKFLDGAGAAG